jgi:hypothetical protein
MSYTQQEAIALLAERDELIAQIAEQQREVTRNRQRHMTSETASIHQRNVIADQYQPLYENNGRRAPAPSDNETPSSYERRLLSGLRRYCKDPDLRTADLSELPDSHVGPFAKTIRNDAASPDAVKVDIPPGVIKGVTVRDPVTGRSQTEFHSSDGTTFIHEMASGVRRVVGNILGVNRLNGVPEPIQPPEAMGRQALHRGLPR